MGTIWYIGVLALSFGWAISLGQENVTLFQDSASNFTTYINENASVGSEVFILPIDNVTNVTDITIRSGDMNDVFTVNKSGVVRVAKFLDYNLLSSVYELYISITSSVSISNATLTVFINDVINWPPVFNESCTINTNAASQSADALLYEIYGNYGKERKPLEELILTKDKSAMKELFNVDTYNSDCNAHIYFGSKRGSISVDDLRNMILTCDTEAGASAEVFTPGDSALIGNPYVDMAWFEEPLNYSILVVIHLYHMVKGTDRGPCRFMYNDFVVLNVKVDIVPQGCPPGKYGFKCEDECICQNEATCHPFNGACRCVSGWIGPACDIAVKKIEVPNETHATYGETVNLICYHYNMKIENAKYGVRWYRNGSLIDDENNHFPGMRIHNSEEGYSSLTIYDIVDSDAGVYDCEVTDMTGQTRRASGKVIVDGCSVNKWGETCEEICSCQNGATCNRYRGCICTHGWNGTTCSQDVEAPTITDCPANIVLSPDTKDSNFTATWKEPIITDNSNQLNVATNAHPGDHFEYGKHTVKYTAVDGGGNMATCEFEVNVKKSGGLPKTVIGGISALGFLLCVLCVVGPYVGYKYRHEIQTLIADKLHPYEDDDGRRFDAFVSVKGDTPDEVFVYRTLLPTLEKKYGFQLCLHHRDFIIGEAIVENIITSIKDSRRTILILSPAFVESEWCDYEVLMAHREMIGLKQKLIPLMFDDVTKMGNIRPSLKSILNTITYISWPGEGDNVNAKDVDKFWKRLVKAMPRKRKQKPRGEVAPVRFDETLQNTSSTFPACVWTYLRNISKRCKRENGPGARTRKMSNASVDFDDTPLIAPGNDVMI
ncbi:uncharacterized protein LOC144437448 [Glandiceps talaboti]